MTFQTKKVRQGTWTGVGQGAQIFGREDDRHFRRQLAQGAILGAVNLGSCWRSHPEGFAGSIGTTYHLYELPRDTVAVAIEPKGGTIGSVFACDGTVSYALRPTRTIFMSPHLHREYPKVGLQGTRPIFVKLEVQVKWDM